MTTKSYHLQKLIESLFIAASELGLAQANPNLYTKCQEMLDETLKTVQINDPLNNEVILRLSNSGARNLQDLLRSDYPDLFADAIYEQIDERLCLEITFEEWLKHFLPYPASISQWKSPQQGGCMWNIEDMSNINNVGKQIPRKLALSRVSYPYGLDIYVSPPSKTEWNAWYTKEVENATSE